MNTIDFFTKGHAEFRQLWTIVRNLGHDSNNSNSTVTCDWEYVSNVLKNSGFDVNVVTLNISFDETRKEIPSELLEMLKIPEYTTEPINLIDFLHISYLVGYLLSFNSDENISRLCDTLSDMMLNDYTTYCSNEISYNEFTMLFQKTNPANILNEISYKQFFQRTDS